MKGARGLLISITGGKDLTLYEVDEAATRIREEVDQDANIIVGATFDESLEGIIRVSVVATGIDYVATTTVRPPETRIAEITHRLRADTQRIAERAEQMRAHAGGAAASRAAGIEQAATAAVAAAVLQQGTTASRTSPSGRSRPKPSLFVEPVLAEPALEEVPKTFIPPQPERASGRAPRMPRIEELPIPAQNEIRAQRGEVSEENPEKRRMSLLQRLAQVGLGRRDGEPAPAAAQRGRARRAGAAAGRARPTGPSRCRTTPSVRPRRHHRGSTFTGGRRRLCIRLWTTISWKFRRSSAARPTESSAEMYDPG